MAYDASIIDAIRARARQVSDPRKRSRYLRAALQTGIVESGLRNLNYGDADSKGWRQERASLYKDPTNVRASVDRFFDEAAQLDRGQKSYELAADVQRPAAQYRGRYRDVAKQAVSLLGQGGGTRSSAAQLDGVPQAGQVPDMSPAKDMLGGLQAPTRRQVTVTAPAAPAFAAKAASPALYQTPQTTAPTRERFGEPQITQALTTIQQANQEKKAAIDSGDETISQADMTAAELNGGKNPYAVYEQRADKIDRAKVPYLWGGGHAKRQNPNSKVTPLDCSGAVSRVLGIDPRVSGQFTSWGKAGRAKGGRGITVYANDEHVLMEINGKFFGTSASNPGGGAGWIPRAQVSDSYLSKFTARHS